MKNIWVLSIKTSLPDTCYAYDNLKTCFFAFESFEKARDALRQELKKLAFTENAMFDGNGGLIQLEKYYTFDDIDGIEIDDDDWISTKKLTKIKTALRAVFGGENTTIDLKSGNYSDANIEIEVTNDSIRFVGTDDGPINGYEPVLTTNLFSMQEEKDYFLYINDRFGQYDANAELYIDLKKTDIN
ncbi:MAG: hypothetical protein J1F24_06840 [Oscillospiraceae bacterium]|nr:hypothetical protein [Oscillospiraceae bacterium]